MKRRNIYRLGKRRKRRQKGGIAPILAAIVPALVAVSKAAALGGASAAAGYGVTKGLEAASAKKKNKRRGRKR